MISIIHINLKRSVLTEKMATEIKVFSGDRIMIALQGPLSMLLRHQPPKNAALAHICW